ncbi:hypothetical protein M758_4G092700, partial [Ceratodon purpureus]
IFKCPAAPPPPASAEPKTGRNTHPTHSCRRKTAKLKLQLIRTQPNRMNQLLEYRSSTLINSANPFYLDPGDQLSNFADSESTNSSSSPPTPDRPV